MKRSTQLLAFVFLLMTCLSCLPLSVIAQGAESVGVFKDQSVKFNYQIRINDDTLPGTAIREKAMEIECIITNINEISSDKVTISYIAKYWVLTDGISQLVENPRVVSLDKGIQISTHLGSISWLDIFFYFKKDPGYEFSNSSVTARWGVDGILEEWKMNTEMEVILDNNWDITEVKPVTITITRAAPPISGTPWWLVILAIVPAVALVAFKIRKGSRLRLVTDEKRP